MFPPYPLTISGVMKSTKLTSTMAVGRRRREPGELWQGRFPSLGSGQAFDHALRTVQEYCDTVDYIHLNPVRRGLVAKPESWTWSSAAEYSGVAAEEQRRRCGLTVDRVRLPADPKTRI